MTTGGREPKPLRFDVFGRTVHVHREHGEWITRVPGPEGKSRHAREFQIPPWVEESDLLRYLADLAHESATPERPDVVRLDDTES